MRSAYALAFLVLPLLIGSAQAQPSSDPAPLGITVHGAAVVTASPDRIVLTFGIETWEAEVQTVRQKNGDALNRALSAIRGLGVADEDIQTAQVTLEPRRRMDATEPVILGYIARTLFLVTLHDPSRVGDAVTTALANGVNQIHGVEYQTSALAEHREKARALALRAARDKAEAMAAVLGGGIGRPLRVQEDAEPVPWTYSGPAWGGGSLGMLQNVAVDARAPLSEATDPLALGKITVRAAVTVTFALEPRRAPVRNRR